MPGGSPDDIKLKFTGQTSINEQSNGILEIYLEDWRVEFLQAYAYQTNAGEATLLNWLPIWDHDGNGIVSITTDAYNANLPLIIEMGGTGTLSSTTSGTTPNWSTYYGGVGRDENEAMTTDSDENLYTVSNVIGSGTTFPAYNGITYPNNITQNTLISKFNKYDEQEFATYFGGSADDFGMAIAEDNEDASNQYVYIGGYSSSANLLLINPVFSNFNQANQTGVDGFLGKFVKDNGLLFWSSYFGGDGDDYITDINMDKSNHKMYWCGYTSSGDVGNNTGSVNGFPLASFATNSFYQPFNQGGFDAFFGQYNTLSRDLVWSTYYGGDGDEYANAIGFKDDDVFIAGKTNTESVALSISSPTAANTNGYFPMANPNGGAYMQTQLGSISGSTYSDYDGFVSQFDVGRSLIWATFFGGESADFFTDLAINTQGVFAVGKTYSETATTGTCSVNTNGEIPSCVSTANGYLDAYKGLGDVLITQFNISGQLKWSTCYGDVSQEAAYGFVSCETDNAGNLYVVSNSFNAVPGFGLPASGIPTLIASGQYNQADNTHASENGYGADNMVLMFNDNYECLWATYFGGGCSGCTDHTGDEISKGITSYNNEWLYFAGFSYSNSTPVQQSNPLAYFDASHDVDDDGYVTKLDVSNLSTFLEELTQNGEIPYLKGYPNPVTSELTILLPFKDIADVGVVFYNNIGQEVLVQSVNAASGEINVNVSSLPKGMYFSKIIAISNQYVYSFIKE